MQISPVLVFVLPLKSLLDQWKMLSFSMIHTQSGRIACPENKLVGFYSYAQSQHINELHHEKMCPPEYYPLYTLISYASTQSHQNHCMLLYG